MVLNHGTYGQPFLGLELLLTISRLFTRDRWVDLGDFFPNYVNNMRWKFGNEEGIYRADVGHKSCLPPSQRMICRL